MRETRYLFSFGRAAEGRERKKRHEEHQDARGTYSRHGSGYKRKWSVPRDTAVQGLVSVRAEGHGNVFDRMRVSDQAGDYGLGKKANVRPYSNK